MERWRLLNEAQERCESFPTPKARELVEHIVLDYMSKANAYRKAYERPDAAPKRAGGLASKVLNRPNIIECMSALEIVARAAMVDKSTDLRLAGWSLQAVP